MVLHRPVELAEIIGMWLDRKRHLTLSFSRPKVTSSCGPTHPDGRMFL